MTRKITIEATKTQKYAQHDPSLPQVFCLAGKTYTLSARLAERIIELDGAKRVREEVSKPDEKDVVAPEQDTQAEENLAGGEGEKEQEDNEEDTLKGIRPRRGRGRK